MMISESLAEALIDASNLAQLLDSIARMLAEAESAFDEPPLTPERLAQLEAAIHTLGGPNRHHEVPGTLLLALIAAARKGVKE